MWELTNQDKHYTQPASFLNNYCCGITLSQRFTFMSQQAKSSFVSKDLNNSSKSKTWVIQGVDRLTTDDTTVQYKWLEIRTHLDMLAGLNKLG